MGFFKSLKRIGTGLLTGGLSEWGSNGIWRKALGGAKDFLGLGEATSIGRDLGGLIGPGGAMGGGILDQMLAPKEKTPTELGKDAKAYMEAFTDGKTQPWQWLNTTSSGAGGTQSVKAAGAEARKTKREELRTMENLKFAELLTQENVAKTHADATVKAAETTSQPGMKTADSTIEKNKAQAQAAVEQAKQTKNLNAIYGEVAKLFKAGGETLRGIYTILEDINKNLDEQGFAPEESWQRLEDALNSGFDRVYKNLTGTGVSGESKPKVYPKGLLKKDKNSKADITITTDLPPDPTSISKPKTKPDSYGRALKMMDEYRKKYGK